MYFHEFRLLIWTILKHCALKAVIQILNWNALIDMLFKIILVNQKETNLMLLEVKLERISPISKILTSLH